MKDGVIVKYKFKAKDKDLFLKMEIYGYDGYQMVWCLSNQVITEFLNYMIKHEDKSDKRLIGMKITYSEEKMSDGVCSKPKYISDYSKKKWFGDDKNGYR